MPDSEAGSEPTQQSPPSPAEGAAPGGPPARQPSSAVADYRLQQTHAEVQEVVGIICENVDRVIKRDERLSELDDRADALEAGASLFESNAAQLKRKYWWKNGKMMIIMGVICAIVVVVIVIYLCT